MTEPPAIPRPRIGLRAMIATVAVVALGLAGWNSYFGPVPRWRRAIRDAGPGSSRVEEIWRARRGEVPGIGPVRLIVELTALLGDPAPEVRQTAAATLRSLGFRAEAEAAVPSLVAALKDADDQVRDHSAGALGHVFESSGRHPRAAITALVAALGDPSVDVRLDAAIALMKAGKEAAAVPALVALLPDTRFVISEAALRVLGRAGDAARPSLLELAGEYAEPGTIARFRAQRVEIAGILARIGDADAEVVRQILREAAEDPAPDIRRLAAEVSARIEDEARSGSPDHLAPKRGANRAGPGR